MASASENHLVTANAEYAKTYKPVGLPITKLPTKKAAIITCMDTRLYPEASYGLTPGEMIIIRNAGASARDAARSTLLSCHVLGIEEVYVVKHTGCGMLMANTPLVHQVMTQNLGESAAEEISKFDPLPIANLKESAEQDVAFLRQHPLALSKIRVTGWIFDTETGKVEKVVE